MERKTRTISLIHTGWKLRKYPVAGQVFFLTSSFIELIRMWPTFDAVFSECGRDFLTKFQIIGPEISSEDNFRVADDSPV